MVIFLRNSRVVEPDGNAPYVLQVARGAHLDVQAQVFQHILHCSIECLHPAPEAELEVESHT